MNDSIRDTATPSSRPRPWVAGILGVLVPGLGQFYSGQALRGVAFAVALLVLGLLAVSLMLYAPLGPVHSLLPALLMLAAWALIVVDGVRRARSVGRDFPRKFYQRWPVYVAFALLMILVVQPAYQPLVRRNVGRSFVATSAAMEPALLMGDYFLASIVRSGNAARGDVVIFSWPEEPGTNFVMRVAGVPHDTLEMRARLLVVNGTPQSKPPQEGMKSPDGFVEPMLWQTRYLVPGFAGRYQPTRDSWGPIVLPAGHYFLLGESTIRRDESTSLATLSRGKFVGKG
jgi:signal peptidase I